MRRINKGVQVVHQMQFAPAHWNFDLDTFITAIC